MSYSDNLHFLRKELTLLIGKTFKKAADDEIVTHGAAIAFYTIFSITPIIILIVYFGGIFLSEEIVSGQLTEFLGDYLDEDLIDSLVSYISTQRLNQSGLVTTVIASGVVIFGATTVISQIKNTLNKIWNVEVIGIHSVWQFLLNRLLSFGMIIILSILLLASLFAELLLAIISSYFQDLFPAIQINLYGVIVQVITLLFAVSFFTLIFKILPDVHARWIDVLVGALVTTLLFLIGKFFIGLFFTTTGIEATYRAAGSLVIFIIWVYYNILTILLGAVFTQVYTELFGGGIKPYRFVSLKKIENN